MLAAHAHGPWRMAYGLCLALPWQGVRVVVPPKLARQLAPPKAAKQRRRGIIVLLDVAEAGDAAGRLALNVSLQHGLCETLTPIFWHGVQCTYAAVAVREDPDLRLALGVTEDCCAPGALAIVV